MPQAYQVSRFHVNQGTKQRWVKKRQRKVRNRSHGAASPSQQHKTYIKLRRPAAKAPVKAAVAIGAVSLLVLSISHLVALQEAPEVEHKSSSIVPPPHIQFSDSQAQVVAWFATPDSIGAIALGVAEGTRTVNGEKTSLWSNHIDPGNGAINQGTFSWQLEAASPEIADQKAIAYIQTQVIPHILRDAEREGMMLDAETLVQGIDLWNQAPGAGADFVESLKHCRQQNEQDDALLCARVRSYYNPTTAQLEAGGFGNELALLKQDQLRRINTIKQVVHLNQHQEIAQLVSN